ncbi:hypothetical protein Nmel_013688 [Mimus melanotis]
MHQTEEFNLLPCPRKNNQVKIDVLPEAAVLCSSLWDQITTTDMSPDLAAHFVFTLEKSDGVDMRAEVGFLARNILIQGEMEDSCYGQYQCQLFSFDTFGGDIKSSFKISPQLCTLPVARVSSRADGDTSHSDKRAVSTFWIANPNNNLIENAAAGAQAGLFIGKGVKTTRANAEDPREYLSVDNARFSDNGIGLTLARDGTFLTDDSSSLEVTRSILVGESCNFGSQRGQNSYWGKGTNGEHRTPPRNKTFLTHGFQIYNGSARMARCTFRRFTPSVDRYSSVIGFFMKNPWQISPQNNVSEMLMEKSVSKRSINVCC